jgi:large subunit ribosomal protein L10
MKTKKEKEEILKDLVEKFKSARGYLLINLLNLKTSSQKKLRDFLKEKNSSLQVVKKTLVYKANPNFPFTDEELKTPFAFIWSFDENLIGILALKELKKEGIELDILKGYLWNQVFSKEEIEKIINLPSKEALILKVLQNLKGQIYRLFYDFKFPLQKLTLVLSSIKK